MLKIKKNHIYNSKLILKFINTLIFLNLKKKIEKLLIYGFFYWKKQLNTIPLFYFFEALLKLRPVMGFYIFIIIKKKKKKIKIKPHFMNFWARWQKAIYWLTHSIKFNNDKIKFSFNLINELYNIVFFEKSNSINQKIKYYKTILLFKTSKNYLW